MEYYMSGLSREEYCIRIKTHKLIVLRFWVESDINVLCDWTQVLLVLYLPVIPLYKPNK